MGRIGMCMTTCLLAKWLSMLFNARPTLQLLVMLLVTQLGSYRAAEVAVTAENHLFCVATEDSATPSEVHRFDLDIDSDNNDGFDLPEGTRWEEQIESHEYSIGKIIETRAESFTPVVLRFTESQISRLSRLQVTFGIENSLGTVRLWKRAKKGPGNTIVEFNAKHSLDDLDVDPKLGFATVWIEAVKAASGIDTKRSVDEAGRPDVFLQAAISGFSDDDNTQDKVKLLPVNADSFFPAFVRPNERYYRNCICAILANGDAGLAGSTRVLDPIESKDFGLRLVKETELLEYLDGHDDDRAHLKLALDVIYYKLMRGGGLPRYGTDGLRLALYRDYNSGDFTLAFQRRLDDECVKLYKNLKETYFRASAGDEIMWRFRSSQLGTALAKCHWTEKLQGIQLAGVGAGGELAISAVLGSGLHADVYSMSDIPATMLRMVHTRRSNDQKTLVELVPGCLERLKDLPQVVSAYSISTAPFQVKESVFPVTDL